MTIEKNIIKAATDSKIAVKVYDDVFSPFLKEAGKIAIWLVKTAQLPFYHFQLAAAYQDRLTLRLKHSVEKVVQENLIPPPDSLLIPIVNQLSYLEDGNFLIEVFQNLLARAMDKTRNS